MKLKKIKCFSEKFRLKPGFSPGKENFSSGRDFDSFPPYQGGRMETMPEGKSLPEGNRDHFSQTPEYFFQGIFFPAMGIISQNDPPAIFQDPREMQLEKGKINFTGRFSHLFQNQKTFPEVRQVRSPAKPGEQCKVHGGSFSGKIPAFFCKGIELL